MQSLLLGTAHWGMAYGITNQRGRLSDDAVVETVAAARQSGLTALDTAPGYGDAEDRIRLHATEFTIQTKIDSVSADPAHVQHRLEASLERLGRRAVWSLVIHDWPSVPPEQRDRVAARVERLRSVGLAERVGVSGYTVDDLRSALRSFERLDVAQLPVSILDQRLDEAAEVDELRSAGGVLQARSILLQGVASGAPSRFSEHPAVRALSEAGDPVGLALGYIASREWIDEVVLGATSAQELTQLTAAHAMRPPSVEWGSFASTDIDLLDPRRWKDQA